MIILIVLVVKTKAFFYFINLTFVFKDFEGQSKGYGEEFDRKNDDRQQKKKNFNKDMISSSICTNDRIAIEEKA